jgi:hypothetical protein
MDELSQFAQATGTTLDPARGHFAVNATDCIFGPAAGVSFAADVTDAETKGFYLLDYVPVVTQMATDASGIGGFINLPTVSPARLVVIQATAGAAGGKSMGSYTFVVRPATFTTASSFPPAP